MRPRPLFRIKVVADHKVLRDIFARHDPQGLIRQGAPQDEYTSEAKMLAKWFNTSFAVGLLPPPYDGHSVFGQIHEEIYAIFCYMFSPKGAGDEEGYEPVAREIADLYNAYITSTKERESPNVNRND